MDCHSFEEARCNQSTFSISLLNCQPLGKMAGRWIMLSSFYAASTDEVKMKHQQQLQSKDDGAHVSVCDSWMGWLVVFCIICDGYY